MEINIPVKRHLLKYFVKHHGNPYKIRVCDQAGILLHGWLSHPQHDIQYDEIVRKYTGTLKVTMNLWTAYNLGLAKELTSLQAVWFNNFIEKDFYKDLYRHVGHRIMFGAPRIKAINEFMDYFDIDESDITIDALVKRCDRSGLFKRSKKLTYDMSII